MFVKKVNCDAFSPKEVIIKIMGYSNHVGKGVRHVEIAGGGAGGQEGATHQPGWLQGPGRKSRLVGGKASVSLSVDLQSVFRMLQTGNISPERLGHEHKVAAALISQGRIKKERKAPNVTIIIS